MSKQVSGAFKEPCLEAVSFTQRSLFASERRWNNLKYLAGSRHMSTNSLPAVGLAAASQRRGNKFKHVRDFDLKAKARIRY